jgi:hypothetical protein
MKLQDSSVDVHPRGVYSKTVTVTETEYIYSGGRYCSYMMLVFVSSDGFGCTSLR